MSEGNSGPSVDRYERTWQNRIDELTRLGWFLSEEDQNRVEGLQDELEDVMNVAIENKKRQEEHGIMNAESMTVEEYRED